MSLFDEFTEIPNGRPPTELINDLIRIIAHDVCQSKRSVHTSFEVVTRSRNLCNEINKLIDEVSNAPVDDWTSYDKYNAMIEPFEEALFRFSVVAEKESSSYLPAVDDITTCLDSIDTWKFNRKELLDVFDVLVKSPFSKPSPSTDITTSVSHDDFMLFSAIQAHISNYRPQFSSKLKPLVQSVQQESIKIQQSFQEGAQTDDVKVLSVQVIMAIYGIVQIHDDKATSADLKNHLSSDRVHKATKDLLSGINKSSKIDATAFDNLNAEWDRLKALLKELSPTGLPPEWTELRKQAVLIRRPYFSQSTVIILECRKLVEHYNAHRKAADFGVLQTALSSASTALRAFVSAVPTNVTNRQFVQTSSENQAAMKAFKTAEKDISACFTAYKMESEWSEWAQKMERAQAEDTAQIKRFQDIKEKPMQSSGNTIKVVLISPEGKQRNLLKEYNMGLSTSLDALLWKAQFDFPNIPNIRLTAKPGQPADQHFKLSDTVESLDIFESTSRVVYVARGTA